MPAILAQEPSDEKKAQKPDTTLQDLHGTAFVFKAQRNTQACSKSRILRQCQGLTTSSKAP
jgi:hypothetical protein